MPYKYFYDSEFQCLTQTDIHGKIVQRMQMPLSDLDKISFLCWVENSELLEELRNKQAIL